MWKRGWSNSRAIAKGASTLYVMSIPYGAALGFGLGLCAGDKEGMIGTGITYGVVGGALWPITVPVLAYWTWEFEQERKQRKPWLYNKT